MNFIDYNLILVLDHLPFKKNYNLKSFDNIEIGKI